MTECRDLFDYGFSADSTFVFLATCFCTGRRFCFLPLVKVMPCCPLYIILIALTANRTSMQSISRFCAGGCDGCCFVYVPCCRYSFGKRVVTLITVVCADTVFCAGRLFSDLGRILMVSDRSEIRSVCVTAAFAFVYGITAAGIGWLNNRFLIL